MVKSELEKANSVRAFRVPRTVKRCVTDFLNIIFSTFIYVFRFHIQGVINYKVTYNHRIGSKVCLPGMRSQVHVSCFNSIINSEEKSLLVTYFVLRNTAK